MNSDTTINRAPVENSKIFIACCMALTVTSMTFAIRAGILGQLSDSFGFTDTELGWINSMAFLGFPVATVLGGLLYNSLGAKRLALIAFFGHMLGLILTIYASGFWTLLVSTFCIGFANGAVEAACNPLVAETYSNKKTTMLNRFHVWFPGGIVIGALISKFFTDAGFSWQSQIAVMIVPTLIYGWMMLSLKFPEQKSLSSSTSKNVKAVFSPLFLFMVFCMTLTATAELGTQQWIERILSASGASPMLILAMITGLMAVGRYFAGPLIENLNPVGVLLFSSIVTAIGIYSMSIATGNMVYVAAILFAIGVTYFWPTMVGFIAEKVPDSGAFGMSLIAGVGILAVSIWNPMIGSWVDSARQQAEAQNLTGAAADLVAGQAALTNLTLFPIALIVAFTGLLFFMRSQSKQQN